jgi:gluconokinase
VQELYCGIDIGTSSAKAVVYDDALQRIFSLTKSYDFLVTGQDRAELDQEEVYAAVVVCLQACVAHARSHGIPLRFISFSSALHAFIAVDKNGQSLTNCITWADMRATAFNDRLKRMCQGQLYRKTGCPGNAIYMPGKILWMQRHHPEVYDSAFKYISIKEYVLWRLTGQWVIDYGVASGGGMLNIHQLAWDPDLLEELRISASQLSELVDGPTMVSMTKSAEETIGADVPLVVGSGDGPLANLGAGSFGTGKFVATIGSSGAIRVFKEKPLLDSQERTWCYRLDSQACLAGGAINNGGIVLKWLIENFCQEEAALAKQKNTSIYRIVNDYVQGVPAGSNGLLFLPFLTGERSPDWNSAARGLIIGLGRSHSKKELFKAAMEGVVMRLYTNFLVLQELAGSADGIIVNGGFTRSPAWLQIMADIFGKRLLLYQNTVNSTLGAVIMGLKAIGRIERYDQANPGLNLETTITPDPDRTLIYRKIHHLYETFYKSNAGLFEQLQAFREARVD